MLAIPTLCWLCALPLRIAVHGICSRCLRHIPPLPSLCPRCGLPASGNAPCGRCLRQPPRWHSLTCVSDYRPPLSDWVLQLKFTRATALRVMLARLLLLKLLTMRREGHLPSLDLVLSVPLHRHRAWQRGYNQAALLAQPVAHWLGCEYHDGLRRIRHGAVQHSLSARDRKSNLCGAFRLETAVQGRHILLIDDVVTTGSTVAEICRILLAQGASSVHIGCLCRTL
ncbi:double zinc ribbon domain-containing protein [Pantoea sp. Mb-10]|uniref:phosphoribosyltransferase family protein n=1 Tax=unclassified Pantoea TaxID=2630326 RepID=UPI001E3515F7|nr:MULTISPECIES: phosphoribosyltransferase family protein [unclassified Pantoea]MCE0492158.1 double zinc ribbon domain-containing protein [Pantoea sp. Mb-10]MCE0503221.1 double zinc ribbon domain-containing protein [Pantoea sp. Pb-8]